jgi:hypothetical protein
MTTLREAVQEFVSDYDCGGCGHFQYYAERFRTALRAALAQEEQEPVAWLKTMYSGTRPMLEVDHLRKDTSTPVYTHPPRREWQGLTEEEIQRMGNETPGQQGGWNLAFARAVEQALRSKNHE